MKENEVTLIEDENLKSDELVIKKKSKKPLIIVLISFITVLLVAVILFFGIPYIQYLQTVGKMEKGLYVEAISEFETMGDYLDSQELLTECKYLLALETKEELKFTSAMEMFNALGEYKDSVNLAKECKYLYACDLLNAKDYQQAMNLFNELDGYKDSADKITECKYQLALKLVEDGEIVLAYNELSTLIPYKDSATVLKSIEATYKMIMSKPKIFVNKDWENSDKTRVWLTTKVIDDNTLQITLEGSNGADDHSTEKLTGKWNESTGMVELSGKSYRTVGVFDEQTGEYVEKTYCEDSNVTGFLYYKNGRIYIEYDDGFYFRFE